MNWWSGSAGASYIDRDVDAGGQYVYRERARNEHGLIPQSAYFDSKRLPEATTATDPPARSPTARWL